MSEEINDRGIGVDMVLVKEAIEIDSISRDHLTSKMQDMTNLDNPNSVQQMKMWLSDNGMEMESLGKKEVALPIYTAATLFSIVRTDWCICLRSTARTAVPCLPIKRI